MSESPAAELAPGLAFDRLAPDYDTVFTFSAVGQSQRKIVWRQALSTFAPGSHILELNCGTGEDALFLARSGMTVTACDASPRMIERARRKMTDDFPAASVQFLPLPTEELHRLPHTSAFDGVFSNFSGLNCVRDLRGVAQQLTSLLRPGAPLLLCLSTRFCLWEIFSFLLRADPRRACRRFRGISQARVAGLEFPVYYPLVGQLRRAFAPEFRLVAIQGVGISVPPSYLESWIARHPRLLRLMEAADDTARAWPGLRVLGDHMLLHLERIPSCSA